MGKSEPHSHSLAGESILKVGCHRLAQACVNIGPVNGGHQGSNKDGPGGNDVVHIVLIIAIVGATVDVGRCKLRVDIVPWSRLVGIVIPSSETSTHVAPFCPVAVVRSAIVTCGS